MHLDENKMNAHMRQAAEGGWELLTASTCADTWSGLDISGQAVTKPGTVLCSMFWPKVMEG